MAAPVGPAEDGAGRLLATAAEAGRVDDAAVVIAAEDQAGAIGAALGDCYVQEFYGLRPDVILTVFIERASWDRFIASRSGQS